MVAMVVRRMFFQLIVLVDVLVLAAAIPLVKTGCPSYCGDVEIPYPFGTSPDCFLNENFLITCNNSYHPPKPFLRESNIPVTNISINGQLQIPNFVARDCFRNDASEDKNYPWLFLYDDLTISNTKNVFTVIGCDSYAYIQGYIDNQPYSAGCMSWCDSSRYVKDGSCIGTGCCQLEIPKGLTQINVTAHSFNNHKEVLDFNPCTYAFVVEKRLFNFKSIYLHRLPEEFPVVVDWTITGKGNCTEARSKPDYACNERADCVEPDNGSGYLCKCKEGYQGNAYLSNGCEDINECNDRDLNNCEHICVNNEGSYTCGCYKGYHFVDGGNDGELCMPNVPNQFQVIKVALSVGISVVMLLVCISWLYLVLKKRKLIKCKEKFFQQNGGFILQQKLSKRSGSSDRAKFKIFTAEELKKATNNYDEDRIVGRGGYGTVYKGFLTKDNPVAIKKSKIVDQSQIEQFINEIVVLSQIDHIHVVRLLGCCLETEVPLLVYEFVTNGTLSGHIHNKDKAHTISGERRLKIAAETAGVLSHLHLLSTPIIHRDVKSANIILDHEYNAKVSDFGASKLVPMNVTQLSTIVQGTLGYLDPEYFQTGQLTDKSDVYSFGVVLVELLTGKKAFFFDRPEDERSLVMYFLSSLKENRLLEIIENHLANDENEKELREVAELAKRCLSVKGEERPPMREVAMELERLRMMHQHPWDNAGNPEETESLLRGTSDAYKSGDASGRSAGYDSITGQVVAFDVDGR